MRLIQDPAYFSAIELASWHLNHVADEPLLSCEMRTRHLNRAAQLLTHASAISGNDFNNTGTLVVNLALCQVRFNVEHPHAHRYVRVHACRLVRATAHLLHDEFDLAIQDAGQVARHARQARERPPTGLLEVWESLAQALGTPGRGSA